MRGTSLAPKIFQKIPKDPHISNMPFCENITLYEAMSKYEANKRDLTTIHDLVPHCPPPLPFLCDEAIVTGQQARGGG